ncbi:cofactor assembly of complex C subunit B [Synechococcus sp. RSCCF101]|uniref:cofactor assembly of complex C subunit B n=1 Tax=Synechococcus sp. RSCCF101 TaxID=2511069 RepID=UPI00177EC6D7|nr:cofactor assembly of complex C subunit B [Synechococcus sp. RSCCF101]
MPSPARICLGTGVLGLLLVVANQWQASAASPPLTRAGTLAALMAVGLMLVAVLWTRAVPLAAERAALQGREGIDLAESLPAALRQELGWGSQMLLTGTPAAVVLLWWDGRPLLRRGLLAETGFEPGPICERCRDSGRRVSLVNLALYPGRGEFDALLPGVPAVMVEPIGQRGWLVLGGWSPRCFSRSDEVWLHGWACKLRSPLEALNAADLSPRAPLPPSP